jgi:hypothetical protein
MHQAKKIGTIALVAVLAVIVAQNVPYLQDWISGDKRAVKSPLG